MDTTSATGVIPAVILCVDDEPNVLSALQRLLRRQVGKVLVAQSAAEGLQVLTQNRVDMVISDMRMPEMDGARFLEQVRQRWPETIRVLLTGYADVESTVAAINKGEIYRYIAKPWDDHDVLLLVKDAMERKALEQEKRRLEALTRKQNDELRVLNASLETKVMERTRALQQAFHELEKSNEQLRKNFLTSVSIFSNLLELRAGSLSGHSRRVADLARKLAVRMGLGGEEIQDVVLAGLLHDIGKIGLSDELLYKPVPALNMDEKSQLKRHPRIAQTALLPLEQMKGAAAIIRAHHERFDGDGYPDGLSGYAIPLGARILAVANDYDAVQYGNVLNTPLSQVKAYDYIIEGRGKSYDPAVVEAFKELVGGTQPHEEGGREVKSADLKSGMVLTRGVYTREGLLLLFKDCELNQKLIDQMVEFERLEQYALSFWVKAQG